MEQYGEERRECSQTDVVAKGVTWAWVESMKLETAGVCLAMTFGLEQLVRVASHRQYHATGSCGWRWQCEGGTSDGRGGGGRSQVLVWRGGRDRVVVDGCRVNGWMSE